MPMAPLRPCCTCGQVGCTQHVRTAWGSSHAVPRIRGRRLQRIRQRLFDRSPLCVQCQKQGRTTIATIRDHVIPLAEGGVDDETNEQALCQMCSDVKTANESKRGQARSA